MSFDVYSNSRSRTVPLWLMCCNTVMNLYALIPTPGRIKTFTNCLRGMAREIFAAPLWRQIHILGNRKLQIQPRNNNKQFLHIFFCLKEIHKNLVFRVFKKWFSVLLSDLFLSNICYTWNNYLLSLSFTIMPYESSRTNSTGMSLPRLCCIYF